MKRNLLLSLALLSAVSFSAQVMEFDNYNSYTNGNVGTNTTGASMGQGSMYLSGGAAADYQIVTGDAAHGKSRGTHRSGRQSSAFGAKRTL